VIFNVVVVDKTKMVEVDVYVLYVSYNSLLLYDIKWEISCTYLAIFV